MKSDDLKSAYIIIRFIQGICIAVFIFGGMWHGTEILQLTLPQFMMLYGAGGAILSEMIARIMMHLLKKK